MPLTAVSALKEKNSEVGQSLQADWATSSWKEKRPAALGAALEQALHMPSSLEK
jgi:hypothetical protein